jgi:hypothetical protein
MSHGLERPSLRRSAELARRVEQLLDSGSACRCGSSAYCLIRCGHTNGNAERWTVGWIDRVPTCSGVVEVAWSASDSVEAISLPTAAASASRKRAAATVPDGSGNGLVQSSRGPTRPYSPSAIRSAAARVVEAPGAPCESQAGRFASGSSGARYTGAPDGAERLIPAHRRDSGPFRSVVGRELPIGPNRAGSGCAGREFGQETVIAFGSQ